MKPGAKPLFKAGHIIVCPHCEQRLYELQVDVYVGWLIESKQLTPEPGVPTPIPGDPIDCPFCGKSLMPAFKGNDKGVEHGKGNRHHDNQRADRSY